MKPKKLPQPKVISAQVISKLSKHKAKINQCKHITPKNESPAASLWRLGAEKYEAHVAEFNAAISDAYDIRQARAECKEAGLKARLVIAHLHEGSVQISFQQHIGTEIKSQSLRLKIYADWMQQAGLPMPDRSAAAEPRYTRCLAVKDGLHWRMWDEPAVHQKLITSFIEPSNVEPSIIPSTHTIRHDEIFPTHKSFNNKLESNSRCIYFVSKILTEAARIYCLGADLDDEFEFVFNALEYSYKFKDPNNSRRPAELLLKCKRDAIRLITDVTTHNKSRKLSDPFLTLSQGFQIAWCLAQAESMISNSREVALLNKMGFGRPRSKLWSWINSDPVFSGKDAIESLNALDGRPDPDHPGKKLKLTGKGLRRGDGKTLSTRSFQAKFKKRKKTLQR